jgi:hypothetical protein
MNDMPKSKPVYCFETQTLYDSMHHASRELNVSQSQIFKCCRKMLIQAKGYHFCYEDDIFDYEPKFDERHNSAKKVIAYKRNKLGDGQYFLQKLYFNSINEAGRRLGIAPPMISNVIHGKHKSTHGYYFMRQDDEDAELQKRTMP